LARFIVDDPPPSLHDHYSHFVATTEQSDTSSTVRLRSPLSTVPAGIIVPAFPQLTTVALTKAARGGLGSATLIAEPEGPTFISYKVARSRSIRLRFVTQDPNQT
jgi:hypothetical protein